jgi:hypothetical protein
VIFLKNLYLTKQIRLKLNVGSFFLVSQGGSMSFLRHITATLLAILIANPLCCCFAQADLGGEETVHSCCPQAAPAGEEVPLDSPCPGCQAKNPRLADGGTQFGVFVEVLKLPPYSAARSDLPGLPGDLHDLRLEHLSPAPPPQRLRLALQQRFLI